MARGKKKSDIIRTEDDALVLKVFGKNLRQIRERKELSQEQIAYQLGFSRSYYAEVETGKRNISLLNIIKITLFLQVEITELIKLNDL